MSTHEFYARYPALNPVIAGYADWDYEYSSPYDVIEPTLLELDHVKVGHDLRRLLADLIGNDALRRRVSLELNVRFEDEAEALKLLRAMLTRLETGPSETPPDVP